MKLVEFVEDVAGVRRNLRTMRNYLLSKNDEERFFARERLRRGYNLVATFADGDVLFAPSRFVGYKNITIKAHKKLGEKNRLDGKETNPVLQRILGAQTLPNDLGSGLIDQTQKMTMAAMAMADMKVCAQRS
ncbi:hypothetical protein [uncultured Jannaschia sp.]|uniref:hypothetical protein n=1 Tax=uncultured Jannaschia sp. TaxID=293347 RepID=UPI00262B55F7|nr:hypothetical protein [uncultured Jannaschia sp.]